MDAFNVRRALARSRLFPTALAISAIIAIFSGLRARPSEALPVFAKGYGGVDCSVCHTSAAVPLLNAYGRYIQRTGYAALDHNLLKDVMPVTIAEEVTFDSQSGNGLNKQVQLGNLALHATGYFGKDLTYHIHQWITQGNQSGGLDTFQLAYSGLLKGNGHLFVGKLSALPVPAPFSNFPDIYAPYGPAEITVGEHMYQFDMMRWGAAFSYVRAPVFYQVSWMGSNLDLNGATDFSNDTDKTLQWTAAYADPAKPFEAGLYGSVGTFPLAEGGLDSYHSIGAYVQRDPGPHMIPGFFGVYQWAYDSNPGNPAAMSSMGAPSIGTQAALLRPQAMGSSMGSPAPAAANSRAYSVAMYEAFLHDRAFLGLRKDMTDDGIGDVTQTGSVELAIEPIRGVHYLHLYVDDVFAQNGTPDWRGGLWWASPLGI